MRFPTDKFIITSKDTVRDPVLLSTARSGTPKTRRLYAGPRRGFNIVLRGLTDFERAAVDGFLAAQRMTAFEIAWCGVPTYGGAVRFPTTGETLRTAVNVPFIPLVGPFTVELNVFVERLFNQWWIGFPSPRWVSTGAGVPPGADDNWPLELDLTHDGYLNASRGNYWAGGNSANGPGYRTPGGYWDCYSTVPVNIGKWNHVGVRFTDVGVPRFEFLMHGKPCPQTNGDMSQAGIPTINPLDGWQFGGWGAYQYPTPVLLDEVRVWNTWRTDAEIADNMNVAMAGDEPGLLSVYHMDETGGTIAHDSGPAALDLHAVLEPIYPDEPGIIDMGEPLQWLKAGIVGYKPDTVFSVIEETGQHTWAKDDGKWATEIAVLQA